jgi:spore maturation protein CgeB
MKIVIFGLTVSSSWGNGHATLWRGLCKAFAERGHKVVFFEKDVPYYSANRDFFSLPMSGVLHLYSNFDELMPTARSELQNADLAMTTSYCPDGIRASELILDSKAAVKAFYDLDTPVTLERVENEEPVDYLPVGGLGDFDLVLSYTGGRALEELKTRLGARRVVPLYGSADPAAHFPMPEVEEYHADLSYLGTYAEDRQTKLEALFVEPARMLSKKKFLIGGAQYPPTFPWTSNIFFVKHMPPSFHPAFFCSSRATLNITRRAMAKYGYCPSGRLFEAAACGVPILTDEWDGLDAFFLPNQELLVVNTAQDVVQALERSDDELQHMAKAARQRALEEHTSIHRVIELENICESLFERWPKLQAAS